MPTPTDLAGWWDAYGAQTLLERDGERLTYSGYADLRLTPAPPPAVPLVLAAGAGDLHVLLDGARLETVALHVPDARTIYCHGPGAFNSCTVTGGGGGIRLMDSIQVRHLDLSGAGRLELHLRDGAELQDLVIGGSTLNAQVHGSVDLLHVVGGDMNLGDGSLSTHRVTSDAGRIVIHRGSISMMQASQTAFRLDGEAILTLSADAFSNLDVECPNGRLMVMGADASVTNLRIGGEGARLDVDGGQVTDVDTRHSAARVDLYLSRGAEAIGIAGGIALHCADNSSIVGSMSEGVALGVVDVSPMASVENVDFFRLNPSLLNGLENARRVTGWWPSRRKDALDRAASIDAGVRSSVRREDLRAHYWGNVARLLDSKDATGHDLIVSHQVAQHTRRLAANGTERGLLEVSRLTGYATMVLRPVVFWAVLAVGLAVPIRMATTGISTHASWNSGLTLAWEIFVSPFTWVRPLSEASDLASLTAGHLGAAVIAFVGRVVGTVLLASAALAVRRYLRNS